MKQNEGYLLIIKQILKQKIQIRRSKKKLADLR